MASRIDKKISRDMKYIALYCSLSFFETEDDIYTKKYSDETVINIYANYQRFEVFSGEQNHFSFGLDNHVSFVMLELLDRLLVIGVNINDIKIDKNNATLSTGAYLFKCYEWESVLTNDGAFFQSNEKINILYKSRLKSGIIQFENIINKENEFYDKGLFEYDSDFFKPKLSKKEDKKLINNLWIRDGKAEKYTGNSKKVIIPEGVTELEICLFWDNQFIEEAILPNSLINIGGDTFYNCKNLKKIVIPKNVSIIGDNPFGGCINAEVINKSKHLKSLDNAIFSSDLKTLVYYPINSKNREYSIPSKTEVLGKHCFYLCKNLKAINIPKSVKLIKNNPFSGCTNLVEVNNESLNYKIENKILYNKTKTTIKGVLESLDIERLTLSNGLKSIGRNSFWNCNKIKKVVLPKSLEMIGYNPFIGCENISFESETSSYKVKNGLLYNEDLSKLICCPNKAIGERFDVPETVTFLERGTFSGCERLKTINLRNVNSIGKSCFSNCTSLEEVYCPDWLNFIGECAFAFATSLKRISYLKGTYIDMNAFINTDAEIVVRNDYSNYLVESNNLYTLQTLAESFENKIDLVYIDPPYNTNISYINYKDDWEGETYLEFMKKRISYSYSLLSNKGFLIIHIDENELNNLVDICSDYFDRKNISIHRWKKLNKHFDENRVILNPNKKQTMYEYIIVCKNIQASFGKLSQPYIEEGIIKEELGSFPEAFDFFGTTSSAKDEIESIFGDRKAFSTPKPVKLVQEIIRATTTDESIIIDFFAGSGTVGEAVMKLNYENSSNRKFILVTNNESNICKDITLKRTQIASNKYKTNVSYLVEGV